MKRVLITGGAGFIGSHLADHLLAHGWQVRVLDALHPQVHGPAAGADDATPPDYLADDVELRRGDVRDPNAVRAALEGVDAVVHLAARVGVGQSMYEIADYMSVNDVGTGVLLEALIDEPVGRLVVASSMSVYGEGAYQTTDGAGAAPGERPRAQLEKHIWEVLDGDGNALRPVPTTEAKPLHPSSVYALSKLNQERLCLMTGEAYDIPTVALRFFNAYGPRQALSNPYTGVLAVFASRYLNGNPPLIFEDGRQQRDFVSVHDVAQACRLALEVPEAAGGVYNVGSGEPRTVEEVAREVGRVLDRTDIEPVVTGTYRVGDIRHCYADIHLAREVLGYQPRVRFADGLQELGTWLQGQTAADHVEMASDELKSRGLAV